jgi:hypothetical protein
MYWQATSACQTRQDISSWVNWWRCFQTRRSLLGRERRINGGVFEGDFEYDHTVVVEGCFCEYADVEVV